jgi:hypothetical protein
MSSSNKAMFITVFTRVGYWYLYPSNPIKPVHTFPGMKNTRVEQNTYYRMIEGSAVVFIFHHSICPTSGKNVKELGLSSFVIIQEIREDQIPGILATTEFRICCCSFCYLKT